MATPLRYVLNKPLKFLKETRTGHGIDIVNREPVYLVIHHFEDYEISASVCSVCDAIKTLCACDHAVLRACVRAMLKAA